MLKKEILIVENLAAFEKLINRDSHSYDINMMVMPGILQDKHKDVDPEKGIQALRRQFNHVSGVLMVKMDDGTELECKPGDISLLPQGHDAWVVGDAPAVVVDFHGMIEYAKKK